MIFIPILSKQILFMEGLEEGNASYSSDYLKLPDMEDLLRYCRTQRDYLKNDSKQY